MSYHLESLDDELTRAAQRAQQGPVLMPAVKADLPKRKKPKSMGLFACCACADRDIDEEREFNEFNNAMSPERLG